MACPPFYNLFKQIPLVPGMTSKPLAPMTESLILFVREFMAMEAPPKPPKKEKNRKKEDIQTGACLEPSYVYKMLLNLASENFKVNKRRENIVFVFH